MWLVLLYALTLQWVEKLYMWCISTWRFHRYDLDINKNTTAYQHVHCHHIIPSVAFKCVRTAMFMVWVMWGVYVGSLVMCHFSCHRFSLNFALWTWSICIILCFDVTKCVFPWHLLHVFSLPYDLCAVGYIYVKLNAVIVRMIDNNLSRIVSFYLCILRYVFFLLYYNFVHVSTSATWFHLALTGHRIFSLVYTTASCWQVHLCLTSVNFC